MENSNTKVVINYFNSTALISTAQEAVEFINKLSYMDSSNKIVCNQHTENLLNSLFAGENLPAYGKPFENYYGVRTTGCGNTQINLYRALADTLEVHNEIVLQRKKEQEREYAKNRAERKQAHLAEMYEPAKGWYIVTVTGLASKLRGNDGKVTKSVKVLADCKMQAYNLAVENLEENPPKNVTFWYSFESSRSALIEYVGVWTDELKETYN